ncbi:hypothetical protein DPEC_G00308710 [Dallia pectoralis]|uniref:Uncharacterized protein n=1 Tax=Dallia pectoralis TaxID=75939 RepID=A0ACC2FER6_DALPE|nr:hypothetical protein DPEC_G00308710 [Dallia pectoralis]
MEMILAFFILPGVLCATWHVEYKPNQVCASKGSSVVIPCTFAYPPTNLLEKVMWSRGRAHFYNGPFIYDNSTALLANKNSKFEYVGDTRQNCDLKINHVELTDSGEYAFRFITNNNGKWSGTIGTNVRVSDTIVSVTRHKENETIKEGITVNLTCTNNCTSEVTWFKNGEPRGERFSTLFFRDISIQDSGNYLCAPQHHITPLSNTFRMNVEYGPRNTSVSVGPALEITRGGNVTLTCSSNANPTVDTFLWCKMDGPHCRKKGTQAKLQLNDVNTDHSGEYICTVSNKHGSQNSTVFTLKVNANAMVPAVTMWCLPVLVTVSTLSMILVCILLTVVWYLVVNRKKNAEPKPGTTGDSMIAYVGLTGPMSDCNHSAEEPPHKDPDEVTYTTVNINRKHNINMK